ATSLATGQNWMTRVKAAHSPNFGKGKSPIAQAHRRLDRSACQLGTSAPSLARVILGTMTEAGDRRPELAHLTRRDLCRRAGVKSRRTYFRLMALIERAGILGRENATTWDKRRNMPRRAVRYCLVSAGHQRKCQPWHPHTPIRQHPKGSTAVRRSTT